LERLYAYTAEVLAFDFAEQASVSVPEALTGDVLHRMLSRTLAAFARSGRSKFLLLGVHSGALAAGLARALPAGTLCVAELVPSLVRALRAQDRLPWWTEKGGAGLVSDSSSWALFALLEHAGFGVGAAFVLPNPELVPSEKRLWRQLELMLTRMQPVEPTSEPPMPRLSAAAILSPAEPDLAVFFRQFPPWLTELVLVWDAPALPDQLLPKGVLQELPFPVRQMARPLGADFSAQRNAMLAVCTADWVLYLDADERLSPEDWAKMPGLCALGASGWHLPRISSYPTADRALVGFGLWPDIQLRLFRNGEGLTFVNPVHERLVGLSGQQGLALCVNIEHLSRLRKNEAQLRAKLEVFDAAGAGHVRHALSAAYPSVPRALVSGEGRCLLLPPEIV
jgi:hypothetical protein